MWYHEDTLRPHDARPASPDPNFSPAAENGLAARLRWSVTPWQWRDVGTSPGRVTLTSPTAVTTSMQVPADASAGQTIQLILEATDNGTPALTRYQRVIVTVQR